MAIRVAIDDMHNALSITLSAAGSYNPDAMDDLRSRALELYRDALITKHAVGAVSDADEP